MYRAGRIIKNNFKSNIEMYYYRSFLKHIPTYTHNIHANKHTPREKGRQIYEDKILKIFKIEFKKG